MRVLDAAEAIDPALSEAWSAQSRDNRQLVDHLVAETRLLSRPPSKSKMMALSFILTSSRARWRQMRIRTTDCSITRRHFFV